MATSSLLSASLKRPRTQHDEDEDENYESRTKQSFVPSELVGDSRWRCVPGAFTRQCVEYKIGDETNAGGLLNSMMTGLTEEEKLRSLKNVGIYTDYPSRTSCEASCQSLPTDPLALAMSMLDAGDIRNFVRTTQNFPQIVSELKDTFKEAKEAQLLEKDIVNLRALSATDLDFKTIAEFAQRTFVDRILAGEGRLFSQRVSHFLVQTFDSSILSPKTFLLLDFLVRVMLQTPGWVISNPDRLYLFCKSTLFRRPYQENWLKLGLFDTLNPNSIQDRKWVLRNILLINDDRELIRIIRHLIPYFAKYDFSKDPILVSYLWLIPWSFFYSRTPASDSITQLELTASLWQLLDQLRILLVEGVDDFLGSSRIFDNVTWYNDLEKRMTESDVVDTKSILSGFITLLQSQTPLQLLEHAKAIQLAIETLLRQPYFAPRAAELRQLLNLYATPPLQPQLQPQQSLPQLE